MSVIPIRSEAFSRGARMLRTALGCEIARWLEEPAVIEVMLNPDGRLWVDRLGEGLAATDCLMSAADGERIIRLVAHHVGAAAVNVTDLALGARQPLFAAALAATSTAFASPGSR